MPSDAAIANLPPRLVRGGKRAHATSPAASAKKRRPAPGKKPATITAKGELAALIDAAKSEPVTITLDGKPAAVVLNARLYRQMTRVLHKLMERDEDRWSIEKMRKAEKEGFVGPAESAAFMREMRDALGN